MRLDEDDLVDLADALRELRASDAAMHSTSPTLRESNSAGSICQGLTCQSLKMSSPASGENRTHMQVTSVTDATREEHATGNRAPGSAVDPDTVKLSDGVYFNRRFCARNVWEFELDPSLVDEAARLYYQYLHQRETVPKRPSSGSEIEMGLHVHHEPICTPIGGFLIKRIRDWGSDIAWTSVDDPQSLRVLEQLWHKMRIPQLFAAVVPHAEQLRMFSAYFVTRTWCESHKWHVDYNTPCGTDALTMMTPLSDFRQKSCFQLSYRGCEDGCRGCEDGCDNHKNVCDTQRRYVYKKGRAVAFGSQFYHSTEVGASIEGEVHAYLCFTFGTDEPDRWPEIAQILGQASRVVQHPDGQVRLTNLGRDQGHSFQHEDPICEATCARNVKTRLHEPNDDSMQQRLLGISNYLRTKSKSLQRLRMKLSCG